jgi:TRAP-type mannitol/chloroaromatic compound transport system substrate-binding protein
MKRRKFLKTAGVGLVAGAAAVSSPAIAQGAAIRWKLQSANQAGTPHDVLLKKFAGNIDKMSNGRLKIEIMPAGAVVNPNEILDATNKGLVDAGQWWTHYAIGKHIAGGLFSSPLGGAATGLDQTSHIAWYLNGGGRPLYVEYYTKYLRADVMPFMYTADGPEALGWFKQPLKSVEDFKKLRYRISSGFPSDVLKELGGVPMNVSSAELIPSAERGVLDAVEWINPSNDIKVGLQDVFKFYSIQGLHQAVALADIMINGKKWRELSPDLQAMIEVAMTTSILDGILYFIHENAKALIILTKEKGVTMFDAPADYAPAWIKASKKILANFEAKDEFFKKILDSQREFAKVVVPYTKETSKLSTLIAGAIEN